MNYLRVLMFFLFSGFTAITFAQDNTDNLSDTALQQQQAQANALKNLEKRLESNQPTEPAETTQTESLPSNQNVAPQLSIPNAQPQIQNPITPPPQPAIAAPSAPPTNAPAQANPWVKPNPWADAAKNNPWANHPAPPAPNTNPATPPQQKSASALPPPPNIFVPSQPTPQIKPAPQTNQPATGQPNSINHPTNPNP